MIPNSLPEVIADLYARIEHLQSRLENRKRTGLVKEVDAAKGLARVVLGKDPVTDEDFVSAWIPWDEMAMGAIKWHTPPAVGEQVSVSSENGEFTDARITTSVPSDQNQRPHDKAGEHVRTVGNARILEKDGNVKIMVGGSTIDITGEAVEITATTIKLTGHVIVKGNMDQDGVHVDSIGPHNV